MCDNRISTTDEKRLAEANNIVSTWLKSRSTLHDLICAALSARDAEIAQKDAEIERLRHWVSRLNNREAAARLRAQPAADLCPGDSQPCFVTIAEDESDHHWRCGTNQCGRNKSSAQPAAAADVERARRSRANNLLLLSFLKKHADDLPWQSAADMLDGIEIADLIVTEEKIAAARQDARRQEQEANTSRQPDYIYDPEDWEATFPWDDRGELVDHIEIEPRKIYRFSTLLAGPDKWAANIVLTWHEGESDETEIRWFDSEAEAAAAVACKPAMETEE